MRGPKPSSWPIGVSKWVPGDIGELEGPGSIAG